MAIEEQIKASRAALKEKMEDLASKGARTEKHCVWATKIKLFYHAVSRIAWDENHALGIGEMSLHPVAILLSQMANGVWYEPVQRGDPTCRNIKR